MSIEEYGKYNAFNSWVGIITIFVSMSLSGEIYTQGLVKIDKNRNTFAASIQGLTFILTVFWIIVYLIERILEWRT